MVAILSVTLIALSGVLISMTVAWILSLKRACPAPLECPTSDESAPGGGFARMHKTMPDNDFEFPNYADSEHTPLLPLPRQPMQLNTMPMSPSMQREPPSMQREPPSPPVAQHVAPPPAEMPRTDFSFF